MATLEAAASWTVERVTEGRADGLACDNVGKMVNLGDTERVRRENEHTDFYRGVLAGKYPMAWRV